MTYINALVASSDWGILLSPRGAAWVRLTAAHGEIVAARRVGDCARYLRRRYGNAPEVPSAPGRVLTVRDEDEECEILLPIGQHPPRAGQPDESRPAG